MRIGVCEAPAELMVGSDAWTTLGDRVRAKGPDVFVLNEMPFGRWIATSSTPDPAVLEASQRAHRDGLARLADLGTRFVLASQAVMEDGRSVNQAFVWSGERGAVAVHTKQFFPNEKGFFEAEWWERGRLRFEVGDVEHLKVGFLLCTDVMFLEWARHYGRRGANLIAVPRATPMYSVERWRTVVRAAAILSGCYVASSNRNGTQDGVEFGGHGWIFHPSGDLLAETTPNEPVAVAEVDPAAAERAQQEYPCYVDDLPPRGAP